MTTNSFSLQNQAVLHLHRVQITGAAPVMELLSQLRIPGLLKRFLHSHNPPRDTAGFTVVFLGFAFQFAFPRLLLPSALERTAEAPSTAPKRPLLQPLLCKHLDPLSPCELSLLGKLGFSLLPLSAACEVCCCWTIQWLMHPVGHLHLP